MNRGVDFTTSPLILLTGAGASVPLGKHTTKQFVTRCLERTSDRHLLEQVLGAIKGRTGFAEVDIEMVLDYLVELTTAYDILKLDKELGPLVSRAAKASDASLADRISTLIPESSGVHRGGLGGDILDFLNSPEYLIGKRKELREELLGFIVDHYCEVDGDNALALYEPLFMAATAYSTTLPFFTLNYDVAVEAAIDASDGRFQLVDGFPRSRSQPKWSRDVFRNYQPSHAGRPDIILFKLHGSTTWGRRRTEDSIVPLPVAQRRNPEPYEHVIMYPSQTKLGLEGEPFATAYSYLAECLEHASTCLVIGTSFRDREINLTFQNALRRSSRLRLVVVGPEVDPSSLAKTLRCDEDRIRPILGNFGDSGVNDSIRASILNY